MKRRHTILAMLLDVVAAFTVCTAASAQVQPAATGSGAKLDYDLSYTQMAEVYAGSEGDLIRGVASGDLEYLNGKERTPLSVTYSGGDIWAIGGSASGTGVFQHLLVSQDLEARKWGWDLSDDMSFLPQSPTMGFSGIPGVGNLPGLPVLPNQPILTLNTRSIRNQASANYRHDLNYETSFSMGGNYAILNFPDGNGLDIDQEQVQPQMNWRLNALNSVSAQYMYSRFSYPGSTFAMGTQSAQFSYLRVWNRRLNTNIDLGPEWIHSSNDSIVPSSTGFTANAGIVYQTRSTSATLNYFRATTGGTGVGTLIGIHNNDASLELSHTYGRNLTVGASGSYLCTQGLLQTGVTNGKFGGVNATQRLGEYITASASYTAIQQSSSQTLTTNTLNGLYQVISFSIAYHPREKHIVRK